MKKTNEDQPAWDKLPENIQQALVNNNLVSLKPAERIQLYEAICEAKGLDKAMRPFEFISLNGKLAMYARKECADQLRERHGVSVTIVSQASQGAAFVVHVRAVIGDRQEDDMGATAIVEPEFMSKPGEGGKTIKVPNPRYGKPMEGIDVANAMMKAVTKGKRRVTLSICGLGMFDESEIETISERDKAKAPSLEEVQKIAAQVKDLRERAAKRKAGSKEAKELIANACELESSILDLPGSGHSEQSAPAGAAGGSPEPTKPIAAPVVLLDPPKAPAPEIQKEKPAPELEPEPEAEAASADDEIPMGDEESDGWRDYIVKVIPHKDFKGKRLGDIEPKKIKVIYDNWALKFKDEIAKNPDKSSDSTTVTAAVKELGLA